MSQTAEIIIAIAVVWGPILLVVISFLIYDRFIS